LSLAHLGEVCSASAAGGAFAAYITGNVASNLVGRLVSAAVADHFGLDANFYFFAVLNLLGAVLVYFTIPSTTMTAGNSHSASKSPFDAWIQHLRNPRLCAAFGIGFCILFAFIGTYTYVNFVLVREPLSLSPMALGFVYFVFLPAVITTPLAGAAVKRIGVQRTLWSSLGLAVLGLPLILSASIGLVLIGLIFVGIGTFFAQATATGYVGQAATSDHASASGIYLAAYFTGGLVGTTVLGQVFDQFGWTACVIGIGAALAAAGLLSFGLKPHRSIP
jgi:predicted MFS family arabinose efflux permease